MKKITFVRHGQTDQNIIMDNACEKNIDRIEGYYDENLHLNTTGKEQAQEAAERLKSEPIEVIYCSTLNRAVETAEIINQYHNAPIIFRDDLCERNTGNYASKGLQELYDFDKNISNNKIETVRDFFKRVYDVMDEISVSKYQNILIVAHGGVHHAVRAYCLKAPLRGNLRIDRVANGDIRTYELD